MSNENGAPQGQEAGEVEAAAVDASWLVSRCQDALREAARSGTVEAGRLCREALEIILSQSKASIASFRPALRPSLPAEAPASENSREARLAEALKYARRFLNEEDHDTEYVDAILREAPVSPAPSVDLEKMRSTLRDVLAEFHSLSTAIRERCAGSSVLGDILERMDEVINGSRAALSSPQSGGKEEGPSPSGRDASRLEQLQDTAGWVVKCWRDGKIHAQTPLARDFLLELESAAQSAPSVSEGPSSPSSPRAQSGERPMGGYR